MAWMVMLVPLCFMLQAMDSLKAAEPQDDSGPAHELYQQLVDMGLLRR